jgi:hypothetical protein
MQTLADAQNFLTQIDLVAVSRDQWVERQLGVGLGGSLR